MSYVEGLYQRYIHSAEETKELKKSLVEYLHSICVYQVGDKYIHPSCSTVSGVIYKVDIWEHSFTSSSLTEFSGWVYFNTYNSNGEIGKRVRKVYFKQTIKTN